ncbi:hypothetical protein CONLIGDRAFT_704117 [Coniochaeta ligniaria NRRL 30616]|uniref:TPR domain-containing protein n=1 Tax=Coniochaeta ligniaria NRRL 30616 TaxID=1408157 RepID=A0A1J7JGR5_9PEZI|nr:hypothetical protein CONLIGDRAFT_704117 [Coniochaeta ligniaria NRRL 30616]
MSGLKLRRLPRTNYAQLTTALHASSCRPLRIALVLRSSFGIGREPTAITALSKHGRRFQSTTGGNHGQDARKQPANTPATPSLGSIFSAAFRSTLQSIRNVSRPETLRDAFRKNPEEMVLALILLTAATGAGFYAIYLYFNYFYHRQFTRYPQPVAKAMRRALYYSNYNPDPERALKYYKQALDLCNELAMDPFSDDVMGIRIQLAAWLEQIDNYQVSAKVLEALLDDCKRWIEVMEKSVKDGTAPKLASPPAHATAGSDGNEPAAADAPPPETLWGKRTRILGKAVGISVKLGELYSNEHMMQQDLAHDRLIWSVETALSESRRRSVEGLKEGEGEWMKPEAIGGALEFTNILVALAHSYESRSQFHLAVPLFLQALRLCQDPCHSAVIIQMNRTQGRTNPEFIVNNLASSFAQHPTQAPFQTVATAVLIEELPSAESLSAADARKVYLETARRWATNANVHARQPQGEQRTAECDEACAVSLCNLGDIAALLGDADEARRMFERCITMSRSLEFTAGVKQAEEGLRSLRKQKKPESKSR